MRKFRNIAITIIVTSLFMFLFVGIISGKVDPLRGEDVIKFLNALGSFFLFVVYALTGFILFGLPITLPVAIYRWLRNEDNDRKDAIEFGKIYSVIFGIIILLSIAGTLLRMLH